VRRRAQQQLDFLTMTPKQDRSVPEFVPCDGYRHKEGLALKTGE
jgi:hypothetical protein